MCDTTHTHTHTHTHCHTHTHTHIHTHTQLLVAHGAPLFSRNVAGQTPCDAAWEAKQLIIAKQLESKMFFAVSDQQF